MNKAEKEAWLKEARMQMQAISRLEKYNMASLAVAGVGAALCYFTMTAADKNPVLIVCSVLLAVMGALSSMILNLGIRNGKRNVEKILNAVEGKEEKRAVTKKNSSGSSKDGGKKSAPSADQHRKDPEKEEAENR